MNKRQPISAVLLLFSMLCFDQAATAQPLTIVENLSLTGTVESLAPNLLTVKDAKGEVHTVRFQSPDKDAVALSGGELLRFPSDIKVRGQYGIDDLESGQSIRVQGQVNRAGRTDGELTEIAIVGAGDASDGVKVVKEAASAAEYSTCDIVCQFTRITNQHLIVKIPPNNGFTRKTGLSFKLSEDARVTLNSDDINRAGPGSKVTNLVAVKLNNGDVLAKVVELEVTSGTTQKASVDDALMAKYRHLSDKPKDKPRLVRSPHFAFLTDVSDREAQVILDKLETMVGLLTKYLGRAPTGIVEGYIVKNLAIWPDGVLKEPLGVAKIRARAGVCFNSSLGSQRRAELYSCDDHGVIQHECTHGFCHLAFGSTGPTWLAEGFAEMGQYWKVDERAVDISPVVMSYLQHAEPKKQLLEIAIPGRTDAGTWQDYAWRWALCHLLANNPNYADRFKPLAISLMEKREGVTFAAVYGPVAKQISFEYDLFLKTVDNGYRADLCAWQWQQKFVPIVGTRRMKQQIHAARGWQATGVMLEEGVSYDIAAVGEWEIAKDGSATDANGDVKGRGKLMATIFHDFKLSEPFAVGKLKRFVAPQNGQLFLRCQDDWNKLADNDGEITVHFRRSPKEQ